MKAYSCGSELMKEIKQKKIMQERVLIFFCSYYTYISAGANRGYRIFAKKKPAPNSCLLLEFVSRVDRIIHIGL